MLHQIRNPIYYCQYGARVVERREMLNADGYLRLELGTTEKRSSQLSTH